MMDNLLKKMKVRQLTEKEKILLYILGSLIISLGAYNFVIEPQAERISDLEEEESKYETRITQMKATIENEDQIDEDWYLLNREKKKILAQYFPEIDQPQIIYLLDDLIDYKDASIEDLNFTRPNYEEIGDFQVENMEINIPYSGEYLGIVDMVSSLRGSQRKILIDNITMDRSDDGLLDGNMNLKIYSLAGIVESDDKDPIYIDTDIEDNKVSPFSPYSGYISSDEETIDDYFDEDDDSDINFFPFDDLPTSVGGSTSQPGTSKPGTGTTPGSGGTAGNKGNTGGTGSGKDNTSPIRGDIVETLVDFESRNNYFMPSQDQVKGRVSRSTNSKSKQYSLRFEYEILAIEDVNRAYVDIAKNKIEFKYPPKSIGLWVYSYDYSPVTIGAGFRSQMGEEVFTSFTEGVNWTGWKYLELSPPSDLSLYPLKLDKLYVEMPKNRDDFGVLLMDSLEAIYPKNTSDDTTNIAKGEYTFHIVSRGETIEGISRAHYGTIAFKNEIMRLNEMKPGDILPVGKILVLKKR